MNHGCVVQRVSVEGQAKEQNHLLNSRNVHLVRRSETGKKANLLHHKPSDGKDYLRK